MHVMPLFTLALVAIQAEAGAPSSQIVVEPARVELQVAESAQLRATVRDGSGRVNSAAEPRWFSANPDIVSVDQSGVIVALRPGTARVSASLVREGAVGFASVRVLEPPPSELMLEAPVRRLFAGTSAPLWVSGRTDSGDAVSGFPVTYVSSDPSVLRVDADGRVSGLREGEARVTASAGAASASAQFEVRSGTGLDVLLTRTRPEGEVVRTGDVVRFAVSGRVADGTAEPLYPVWSLTGSGAQIEGEGSEGVFVAEEAGRYQVLAYVGDGTVLKSQVDVEERTSDHRLVSVGRGAIASHHSGDMWVFEGVDGRDYVYVGTFMHDWMKVWDVTSPEAPILTDSIQLDARRINDVKIHPNARLGIVTREGASNRRNGMVFLDLTTPAHPTILSEYTETVTGGVHNVWVDGENQLVYACHNGTSDVHIIDISDPSAPTEIGRWGLEDSPQKTLHDVIVQDGYAYLSYWDDGVIILDVGAGTHGGSPASPEFVSQYKYPIGNTHVAWRSGRYLFLGDEIFPEGWNADRPIEARGYIHVVDVEDIENPREVAWYEIPEAGAHNVWIEDDKLYVGYYQAGLRVVDISGELRGDLYRQGRELAAYRTTDSETTVPNWPMAWGAQIYKGNIYSSDLNSGIWITRLETGPRVVF